MDSLEMDFDMAALLQGVATYSHERTLALQVLGRSIDEDFVATALDQMSLQEVLPYLVDQHPDCQFLVRYESFCWHFGVRLPIWSSRPDFWAHAGEWDPHQMLFAIKGAQREESCDVEGIRQQNESARRVYTAELVQQIRDRDPMLARRFERMAEWAQYWVPLLDERA
jgi:hypothetical protein